MGDALAAEYDETDRAQLDEAAYKSGFLDGRGESASAKRKISHRSASAAGPGSTGAANCVHGGHLMRPSSVIPPGMRVYRSATHRARLQ
jgi:hypothetical protein